MDTDFFLAFFVGFIASAGAVVFVLIKLMKVRKPSEAELNAAGLPPLPQTPPSGQGLLYVLRPSRFGFAISFGINLDDRTAAGEVAKFKGHQYVAIPIEPGRHTLFVKTLENAAEAPFEIQAGQAVGFLVTPTWGAIVAHAKIEALDERAARFYAHGLSQGSYGRAPANGVRYSPAPH